jgi:hypothetical protein
MRVNYAFTVWDELTQERRNGIIDTMNDVTKRASYELDSGTNEPAEGHNSF